MQPTDIKTPNDLMSVALQAEREAVQQYAELARLMQEAGNPATAALFERMASEERKHEQLLQQWLQQEGIQANEHVDSVRWQDPNVSTTYDEEACSPDQSTPYRALAFAVHNEENAFRFYTRVAAETCNPKVREYAEILAHEELGHAALLRAERRRAYHAERDHGVAEPTLDPALVANEADLLLVALGFDRLLADKLDSLDKPSQALQTLADSVRRQISKGEKALQMAQHKNILPGESISQRLEQVAQHNARRIDQVSETTEKLRQLYNCCERAFVFYDTVVTASEDEQIMLRAQDLTAATLKRIGLLKKALKTSDN